MLEYHSTLLRKRRLFNVCSVCTDIATIIGIECVYKVCKIKIVTMRTGKFNFFA